MDIISRGCNTVSAPPYSLVLRSIKLTHPNSYTYVSTKKNIISTNEIIDDETYQENICLMIK